MAHKPKETEDIDAQLAALDKMSLNVLRELWRHYFKSAAPSHYQRAALARRIGYQMQVAAYGGLSKTVRLTLKRLSQNTQLKSPDRYVVPSGTRITKAWRGREIIVMVEGERQFCFEGKQYKSLSAIASELVGCRQSGTKFFGLNKKRYIL